MGWLSELYFGERELLKAVLMGDSMWSTEPTWGPEALAKVKCPVWIVDGDYDTSVERN